MNKLTKIFTAVVFAGCTATAGASPLFMNPGDNDSGVPFGDARRLYIHFRHVYV